MFSQSRAARLWVAVLAVAMMTGQADAQAGGSPVLTLRDARARAVADAPILRANEAAARAGAANLRQADRGLNPTLDVGAENLAGWGTYSGIDRLEATLSLSQTLERGGDREARTGLARADLSFGQAQSEARRQDLLLSVENAYIAAQVAAADLAVANDRLAVAREIVATVDRRVAAARDPLMAGSRSQALLADAEIALERARLADEAARRNLASFWGGEVDFQVDLALFDVTAGGALGRDASPEIAQARAAEERAVAAIAVERAKATLDPTMSAGIRYFNEQNEAALVFGLSIPLAANDRNTAGVARAEAERSRARFEAEALRRDIDRQIESASAQMTIAKAEVGGIDARLIPAAEEALARAREGYAAGAFSYLDVLDSQRVLLDARLQRNSALGSYHRAKAQLTRLTGGYSGDAPAGRSQ